MVLAWRERPWRRGEGGCCWLPHRATLGVGLLPQGMAAQVLASVTQRGHLCREEAVERVLKGKPPQLLTGTRGGFPPPRESLQHSSCPGTTVFGMSRGPQYSHGGGQPTPQQMPSLSCDSVTPRLVLHHPWAPSLALPVTCGYEDTMSLARAALWHQSSGQQAASRAWSLSSRRCRGNICLPRWGTVRTCPAAALQCSNVSPHEHCSACTLSPRSCTSREAATRGTGGMQAAEHCSSRVRDAIPFGTSLIQAEGYRHTLGRSKQIPQHPQN